MDDKKLIREVKKFKNLYERRSSYQRNTLERSVAWRKISEAMKFDEAVCQTRWKNIRDRYVRLLNQKNQTPDGYDNINENSWHLMKQLQFLNAHIRPKRTKRRSVPVKEEPLSEEFWDPSLYEDFEELLEDDCIEEDEHRSTSRNCSIECEKADIKKQCDEIIAFKKYTENNQVVEELDDEKLITEVKKFKNLYERENKDYRNKRKTSRSWKEISLEMNFDEAACRSRWKNVRDHYVKICQRNQASGRFSINGNNWHLFDQLGFLKDYIQPRRSNMPTSAKEEDSQFESDLYPKLESSQNDFSQSIYSENDEISVASRNRISNSEEISKQLDEMHELTKYAPNYHLPVLSPSKHLPFLQTIEQKLEELPDDHQDDVKLNIITYVFNYVKKFKQNQNTDDLSL